MHLLTLIGVWHKDCSTNVQSVGVEKPEQPEISEIRPGTWGEGGVPIPLDVRNRHGDATLRSGEIVYGVVSYELVESSDK